MWYYFSKREALLFCLNWLYLDASVMCALLKEKYRLKGTCEEEGKEKGTLTFEPHLRKLKMLRPQKT